MIYPEFLEGRSTKRLYAFTHFFLQVLLEAGMDDQRVYLVMGVSESFLVGISAGSKVQLLITLTQ